MDGGYSRIRVDESGALVALRWLLDSSELEEVWIAPGSHALERNPRQPGGLAFNDGCMPVLTTMHRAIEVGGRRLDAARIDDERGPLARARVVGPLSPPPRAPALGGTATVGGTLLDLRRGRLGHHQRPKLRVGANTP